MPYITVVAGDGREVSCALDGELLLIGRDPASDVVVKEARASRRHAEIRRNGESWSLVDLGSRNGTRYQGERLTRPHALRDGDEFEIGAVRLRFHAGSFAIASVSTLASVDRQVLAGALGGLVGDSPAMAAVRARIAKVAPMSTAVLLVGESGTGKEMVAKLIHRLSPRASGPIEVINCPALPASLVEAELFGIERGTATGVEGRAGRLERAHHGTLFLDEIGDLDLTAQAKLLRFLQDHVVERVGGRGKSKLDVRIVAATNCDLAPAMAKGSFRRDLYHRLLVSSIEMPPLRDHPEDIPALVDHFLSRRPGLRMEMTAKALGLLSGQDFPGNVRELEHTVESACILAEGTRIEPQHLPQAAARHAPGRAPAAAAAAAAMTSSEDETVAAGDALYRRIRAGQATFWEDVRDPYLGRKLARPVVRALFLRMYQEAGGSHKEAARLLGVDDGYRRFLDFVRYHRLRVRDLISADGA